MCDRSNESWVPVHGYEETYEVSNRGRVRSLDRLQVMRNGQERMLRGKMLRYRSTPTGYLRVSLYEKAIGVDCYIHRMVAEHFIGPASPGLDVCHWDGDKANNCVCNLRYGTRAENMEDQKRHGTHANTLKTHCIRGHRLTRPNLVEWKLRQGFRLCLSCTRPKKLTPSRRPTTEAELHRMADEYYSAIMATAS